MNLFTPKDASSYVKEEFDEMQSKISPFMKRSLIYSFIAFPLMAVSIFNLFFVLTSMPYSSEVLLAIGVLALIGAFGMALFRESLHHNKSLHQTSINYIRERIAKSEIVPEQAVKRYLKTIDYNPNQLFHTFHEFLKHEERLKR
ncbi:DUF5392 family protein [Alkalibacillus haloalkaliphilus]|uniref:Uncharacterized protein n=1 Tax=Alkalibacillus haloalkaliphilus TaxID=94136 RepID=A0A511W5A5_9BACI|nr:DUF5392 family protein [Alkalibacillus haloalkaliphilus]GEN46284.1 hypothetical protein AHA02nite_20600 [Alkalibacillus haloalkaliphilus]